MQEIKSHRIIYYSNTELEMNKILNKIRQIESIIANNRFIDDRIEKIKKITTVKAITISNQRSKVGKTMIKTKNGLYLQISSSPIKPPDNNWNKTVYFAKIT